MKLFAGTLIASQLVLTTLCTIKKTNEISIFHTRKNFKSNATEASEDLPIHFGLPRSRRRRYDAFRNNEYWDYDLYDDYWNKLSNSSYYYGDNKLIDKNDLNRYQNKIENRNDAYGGYGYSQPHRPSSYYYPESYWMPLKPLILPLLLLLLLKVASLFFFSSAVPVVVQQQQQQQQSDSNNNNNNNGFIVLIVNTTTIG